MLSLLLFLWASLEDLVRAQRDFGSMCVCVRSDADVDASERQIRVLPSAAMCT